MRLLIALFALVALLTVLAPPATAAQCPPMCVGAGVQPTLPSDGCGDCIGVTAYAYTLPQDGCADCETFGVVAGAEHEDGETTVTLVVCRGGFIHICPVDHEIRV